MNPVLRLKYCLAIVTDPTAKRTGEPCFRISKLRNGCCGRHQHEKYKIHSFDMVQARNKFIVAMNKKMYAELDVVVGKENKKRVLEKILSFLGRCGDFLGMHDEFARTCYAKLDELDKNEPGYKIPGIFLKIMFKNAHMDVDYVLHCTNSRIKNISNLTTCTNNMHSTELSRAKLVLDMFIGHPQLLEKHEIKKDVLIQQLTKLGKNQFDGKYLDMYEKIVVTT